MARPALSAARSIDIIDLLAATPGRSLTLSDIARATGINTSSCHSVLNVLVERGYLNRDPQLRTYALGPVIYAAGQAALAGQPLLTHAVAAARAVFEELGIPVLISAAIGDEIVGIVSISDGRTPLLRVGERRALMPPIGAPFVAWSGEAAIAEWLAAAPDADPGVIASLHRGVETIRDRGFEVLLRSTESSRLASQLLELAAPAPTAEARSSAQAGFHRLGPNMALPDAIESDRLYDVQMIAAPIFDRHGACAYNFCLGPFPALLTGASITDLADRLLSSCVQIMHADRAQQ